LIAYRGTTRPPTKPLSTASPYNQHNSNYSTFTIAPRKMGSAASRPTQDVLETEKFDSVVATRTVDLANLTLNDSSSKASKTLDTSLFSKWEHRLMSDPKNQLALSAFTQGDMLNLIRRREAVINDGLHLFSDKIEVEGKPVTNQRSSGRCWLFASTNVMRVGVIKKYFLLKENANRRYKLTEFEFSQQYLFFWDKLEKANCNIILRIS
jgi:bleomycin hydrolase